MKYLSIAQTAERWGISTRRIQILCGEGRVPGAIRIGTVWSAILKPTRKSPVMPWARCVAVVTT